MAHSPTTHLWESRWKSALTLLFRGCLKEELAWFLRDFTFANTWYAFERHFGGKYGCKTHRSSKVASDSSSYLQVLVGFQGPDGGVSEFDMKESLIWAVFVDFATGEPIPMLLSQRCHFYNWTLIGDIQPPTSRRRGVWVEPTHKHTHAGTHMDREQTHVPRVSWWSSVFTGLFVPASVDLRFGFTRSVASHSRSLNEIYSCLCSTEWRVWPGKS